MMQASSTPFADSLKMKVAYRFIIATKEKKPHPSSSTTRTSNGKAKIPLPTQSATSRAAVDSTVKSLVDVGKTDDGIDDDGDNHDEAEVIPVRISVSDVNAGMLSSLLLLRISVGCHLVVSNKSMYR
jgi:hypothetical protein